MPNSRFALVLETDGPSQTRPDRRRHFRLIMVGRAVRLDAMGDRGLCTLLNLSDGGASIETPIALQPGDPVRISFDCANHIQGRVTWAKGGKAGIQFLVPMAILDFIKKMASDRSSGATRPPRLPVNSSGLATTGSSSFPTVVGDISQGGMRIWHAGRLAPGATVDISMAGGIQVRGIVRWSDGNSAGIEFQFPLSVPQLARRSQL